MVEFRKYLVAYVLKEAIKRYVRKTNNINNRGQSNHGAKHEGGVSGTSKQRLTVKWVRINYINSADIKISHYVILGIQLLYVYVQCVYIVHTKCWTPTKTTDTI